MIIDGIAASEAMDRSGERLLVAGADISSFNGGRAALVWEHRSGNKGTPLDVVGKVTSGKKIFSEADCANDREKAYWRRVKMPFIYYTARIADGEGHAGADALAGLIRDSKKHNEPMLVSVSIEGHTVKKTGHLLEITVARALALAVRECNATCAIDVLQDTRTPVQVEKREAEILWHGPELELDDLELPADLAKAYEAGGGDVAPSAAAGGAALAKAGPPPEPLFDVHWRNPDRGHAWETFAAGLPHERAARLARGVSYVHGPRWYDHNPPTRLVPAGAPPVQKDETLHSEVLPLAPLTQDGLPADAGSSDGVARLDEEGGVLATPRGTLRLDDGGSLEDLLRHPAVDRLHARAAAGWERAHQLLADRKLPDEVAAHVADAVGLPPGAEKVLAQYARVHGADAGSAAGALVRHVASGGPDEVPGLTPSAARRALLLMGAGSIVPHDPDVLRHVFGLDGRRDAATGVYVSALLDDPNQGHLADALDRWYAGHGAVRHLTQDPIYENLPVDHLLGLAALRHHLVVGADEARRGRAPATGPSAEGLDPFGSLTKDEGDPAAAVHRAYEGQGGSAKADLLYFAFLLPRILDAAKARASAQDPAGLAGLAPRLENAVLQLQGLVPPAPADGAGLWPGGPQVRSVALRGLDPSGYSVRAGRIMVLNGNVHHLEDHHDVLQRLLPEGPLDENAVARLHALEASPHLDVALDHSLPQEQSDTAGEEGQSGRPGEGVGDSTEPPVPSPPALAGPEAYRYRRAGTTRDLLLELNGELAYVDGQPAQKALVDLMLANVQRGIATLEPAGLVSKGDVVFLDLTKAVEPEYDIAPGSADPSSSMDPAEALDHIRAAVRAGHVHPDVAAALTRHIYVDPMTAEHSIGNKYAASKFLEKKKPGVYVMMDSNDFREVNNRHGHEAGDQAIRAMGGALRGAMGQGPGSGKLFRNGGDEFIAHFPSHEHAVQFLHRARQTFDAVPPVGGTHKLSMSFGLGADPHSADSALYDAKKQKLTSSGARAHAPGQVPMLAHSRVPGKEGPIQLHHQAPPVLPAVPTPKAA